MKKLLLILPLLALCLPAQVQLNNARLSNFQVTVTGGGCVTAGQLNTNRLDLGAGNQRQMGFTLSNYFASVFTASNTVTACKVSCPIQRFNFLSEAGHYFYVSIWSNNSGNPGTLIGESSGLEINDVETTTTIPFTLSAAIVSGTKYWIVFRIPPADNLWFIGVRPNCFASESGTTFVKSSVDGSNWADVDITESAELGFAITY